jgi:hypothetical protein
VSLNTAQLNAALLNQGTTPPAADAVPSLGPTLGVPYRFEVYTRAGSYVGRVGDWRGGERRVCLNEPDVLRIEVAASDSIAASLVFPNEIWMWLGEYGTVWQKFKILTRREKRDGAGHWITVECESLIGDLAREHVAEYATPVEIDEETEEPVEVPASVETIIGDLLSLQTQTPAIRRGIIDTSIGSQEISIRFEGKSVLACLFEIQRIVGGWFWVDTSRRLYWRRNIGYDAGHWLRLDHNMTDIEVFEDYRKIKTRVEGRGAGFSEATRLASTANDATAQSQYGVIVGRVDQKKVNEQGTLDTLTQAELDRAKSPATSFRMGVLDLSQVSPTAYSFSAAMLTVGTVVNVICDSPAVDHEARVRSVRWNLADPMKTEVEFTDPDAGSAEWGGNDGTHEPDVLDQIAAIVQAVDDATSDTGIAVAVARSMDPPTDDVQRILTLDNAADRLATILEQPYGEDDAADEFGDAMLQRLIDALGDSNHPLNSALRAAVGASGQDDVWVEYLGS